MICSTYGSDTGSSSEIWNGLFLVLSFSPALLPHVAAVRVCDLYPLMPYFLPALSLSMVMSVGWRGRCW